MAPVTERTGVGVLEFYASTEGTLVLANAAGDKVGASGGRCPAAPRRPSRPTTSTPARSRATRWGTASAWAPDEAGPLMARVDAVGSVGNDRVQRDVFEPGDAWPASGDLVRRDEDGDYWFVDRLADVIRTAFGLVPSRLIEDALYELPEVALAAVYGVPLPARQATSRPRPWCSGAAPELDGRDAFLALEAPAPGGEAALRGSWMRSR